MTNVPSVKDLEALLFRELTRELSEFQFRAQPARQQFVRQQPAATWVIHVGFVRHRNDVDATIDLGVVLPQVEKLLNGAGWQGNASATIGAEIGNIVDGRPRRWAVRNDLDAVEVASQMVGEVANFGLQWLEKFSNPESVFETLVPNDRASWLVMPHHVKRSAILIALALLLRSRDHAADICRRCRLFLVARKDPQLDAFDQLTHRMLQLSAEG